ncbi:MAG: type 4a pilus biogenesis protein PilO [Bacillota bacterium]
MPERESALRKVPVIVYGVAAIILVLIMIYLQVNYLRNALAQKETESNTLSDVRVRLQQLIRAKEQAQFFTDQYNSYKVMLPDKPDEEGLIADIQRGCAVAGVHFVDIHFEERAQKGGYVEMPVKIVVEGRFQNINSLLGNLSDGRRMFRIDDVKIGQGKQSLPVLTASISASAFCTNK